MLAESLELSLNQITGTIPSSVQQLTSLQYFAIAFNELTDASIPTVLGRMTSLQALNMKSSQIRGTVPTELGQLAGLSESLVDVTHAESGAAVDVVVDGTFVRFRDINSNLSRPMLSVCCFVMYTPLS